MTKFVAKYASVVVASFAMVFAVSASAWFANKPETPKSLLK